ncbi:hypothetical protein [Escherichia coli]|uniref:hypothetical protein n=1 Tax=Escherichia coli TaxID=562 RepID=UPI00163C26FF|nr:hypothetical protein [Escherichia coli]
MRNPTIPPGVMVENLSGSDSVACPQGDVNLPQRGIEARSLAEMILGLLSTERLKNMNPLIRPLWVENHHARPT